MPPNQFVTLYSLGVTFSLHIIDSLLVSLCLPIAMLELGAAGILIRFFPGGYGWFRSSAFHICVGGWSRWSLKPLQPSTSRMI